MVILPCQACSSKLATCSAVRCHRRLPHSRQDNFTRLAARLAVSCLAYVATTGPTSERGHRLWGRSLSGQPSQANPVQSSVRLAWSPHAAEADNAILVHMKDAGLVLKSESEDVLDSWPGGGWAG